MTRWRVALIVVYAALTLWLIWSVLHDGTVTCSEHYPC